MTTLFTITWVGGLIVLMVTRINNLSIFLFSTLVYSSPVLWAYSSDQAIMVMSLVIFLTIIIQLLLARYSKKYSIHEWRYSIRNRQYFINGFFNFILTAVFLLIVSLDGGLSGFIGGKYSSKAGGFITLYYTWNTLLLLTAVQNIFMRPVFHPFNIFCFVQLFFIFIGGDRTVLFLFVVILLRFRLSGFVPLKIVNRRNVFFLIFFVSILPVLAVSKSIYTLVPNVSSIAELLDIFSSDKFWLLATKDFEPTHTYSILVYVTQGIVNYDYVDLLKGALAIIPGSSFLGIDPHAFSTSVRAMFFSSWSEDAGVGANFWAQGYVVGGFFGVILFWAMLVFSLVFLDNLMNTKRSSVIFGLSLSLTSILGFYIQRNSMEQILSFAGRYVFIFILVYLLGMLVSSLLWKYRK